MSDTNAQKRLRSFIERIERLEEERKQLADDIADVFKELAVEGYDKNAAKVVLKIRRAADGMSEYQERSAMVDIYLAALGMLPSEEPARAPAHARGKIEEFRSNPPNTQVRDGTSSRPARQTGEAVSPPAASPVSPFTPASSAGADGHPSIPTDDAREAGEGAPVPDTNSQSSGAVISLSAHRQPLDIGDIPSWMDRRGQ